MSVLADAPCCITLQPESGSALAPYAMPEQVALPPAPQSPEIKRAPARGGLLADFARTQNPKTMRMIVDVHQPHMLRVAARFGPQGAAEDIVQDVFLRLANNPGAFKPDLCESERSYLMSAVYRRCIDYRRAKLRKNRRTVPLADGSDPEERGRAAPEIMDRRAEDPAKAAEGAEEQFVVRAAIASLSPGHREILELICVKGLKYREAAELLGIPVGTVKSRLALAKRSLAEELRARGLG